VDSVSLQHEFGIFGGPSGDFIIELIERLHCPVFTTLHTVLRAPDDDQMRVMTALLRVSRKVIVMSEFGRQILRDVYHAPDDKVLVIPHGAPDRPFVASEVYKQALGLSGRRVLLTFGLLSPNKGIESVIESLPALREAFPDVLYVVLGATHPHLLRREGDIYRQRLQARAAELGVTDHVRFVDQYVSQEELLDFLGACDIYVTPYRTEAQITSGTLAYAVALGKAVVSTPYWHAAELLADDTGVLVDFNDPAGLEASLASLLADDEKRSRIEQRAYAKGRATVWARSGEAYYAAFEAAARPPRRTTRRKMAAPAMQFGALARITDDRGVLQHSVGIVPNRNHGYCLDDAVRALILMNRAHAVADPALTERIAITCAALIEHAWNPDRNAFRNFMSYDGRWLEDIGSEDSAGRTFWALGETVRSPAMPVLRQWALDLLKRTQTQHASLTALRARAFCVLGAGDVDMFDQQPVWFRRSVLAHAGVLYDALRHSRRRGWIWFEPSLTYDNARLAEALLLASELTGSKTMRDDALAALDWLAQMQTGTGGVFNPQGNAGFGERYAPVAAFDQQPVEAAAMTDACAIALRLTGDRRWLDEATRAFAWFYGENTLGLPIISGDGCHDGLEPGGVNINHGAESVLSAQFATYALATMLRTARVEPE
jgi:glycosyltransferase involved in cell wall biosynthesis